MSSSSRREVLVCLIDVGRKFIVVVVTEPAAADRHICAAAWASAVAAASSLVRSGSGVGKWAGRKINLRGILHPLARHLQGRAIKALQGALRIMQRALQLGEVLMRARPPCLDRSRAIGCRRRTGPVRSPLVAARATAAPTITRTASAPAPTTAHFVRNHLPALQSLRRRVDRGAAFTAELPMRRVRVSRPGRSPWLVDSPCLRTTLAVV